MLGKKQVLIVPQYKFLVAEGCLVKFSKYSEYDYKLNFSMIHVLS